MASPVYMNCPSITQYLLPLLSVQSSILSTLLSVLRPLPSTHSRREAFHNTNMHFIVGQQGQYHLVCNMYQAYNRFVL